MTAKAAGFLTGINGLIPEKSQLTTPYTYPITATPMSRTTWFPTRLKPPWKGENHAESDH